MLPCMGRIYSWRKKIDTSASICIPTSGWGSVILVCRGPVVLLLRTAAAHHFSNNLCRHSNLTTHVPKQIILIASLWLILYIFTTNLILHSFQKIKSQWKPQQKLPRTDEDLCVFWVNPKREIHIRKDKNQEIRSGAMKYWQCNPKQRKMKLNWPGICREIMVRRRKQRKERKLGKKE